MPASTDHPADRDAQDAEVLREGYTMALYVGVCLLAALIAAPEAEAHGHVIEIIWGISIGLALAHWFAFRVSTRLVGAGAVRTEDVALGLAQLAGSGAVALVASVPVLLLPPSLELVVVEVLLATVIAVAGFAAARGGGASIIRSASYAAVVLVAAVAVALVKNALGGH